MLTSVFAIIFTVLTAIVIVFQGFLAAGMPWGAASMGGKFPGKYPPKMRIVAVINMLLLAFFVAIVMSRAELAFLQIHTFSRIAIWFIVVFFVAGTIMNTITPSKIERIWAPVALFQLITSILVAIS